MSFAATVTRRRTRPRSPDPLIILAMRKRAACARRSRSPGFREPGARRRPKATQVVRPRCSGRQHARNVGRKPSRDRVPGIPRWDDVQTMEDHPEIFSAATEPSFLARTLGENMLTLDRRRPAPGFCRRRPRTQHALPAGRPTEVRERPACLRQPGFSRRVSSPRFATVSSPPCGTTAKRTSSPAMRRS